MAGKPSIPPSVHAHIRTLYSQGVGKKAIGTALGVSKYTVERALDEGYAEREAARQRKNYPHRHRQRRDDPAYIEAQAKYAAKPERLAKVRQAMAAHRAALRAMRGSSQQATT